MRNRNYDCSEVHEILTRLVEMEGAEKLLDEIEIVTSTDRLADILTDVCDDYDIDMDTLLD